MANETFELGRASGILADAVGEAGNRRFRILARNEQELVNLWVEREQLLAMTAAVDKLMVEIPDTTEEDPDRPPREGAMSFDLRPILEFRVGQLALGYDQENKLFLLIAHDAEAEPEPGAAPAFSCYVTREQLQAFGFAVYALVAAGRARCPICGRPTDSGRHDHAESNGHRKEH